jgi:glutamate racemase
LPVIGVIEPGASAAVTATPEAGHLVLATEATVRLGAYRQAILRLDSAATVEELACELLVALAEEGWTTGGIADAVIRRYLQPYLAGDGTSTLPSIILGCTHFPLLRDALSAVAGDHVSIVDSAGTTATVVAERLLAEGLTRTHAGSGSLQLLATDGPRRFARVGGVFLGTALSPDDVEIVDL